MLWTPAEPSCSTQAVVLVARTRSPTVELLAVPGRIMPLELIAPGRWRRLRRRPRSVRSPTQDDCLQRTRSSSDCLANDSLGDVLLRTYVAEPSPARFFSSARPCFAHDRVGHLARLCGLVMLVGSRAHLPRKLQCDDADEQAENETAISTITPSAEPTTSMRPHEGCALSEVGSKAALEPPQLVSGLNAGLGEVEQTALASSAEAFVLDSSAGWRLLRR